MKKKFQLSNLFFIVLLVVFSIWLGSSLSRTFFTYNIFQSPNLELRHFLTDDILKHVLVVHQPLVTTTALSFALLFITFWLYLFTSRMSLKTNGWLFIATGLFILFSVLEVYMTIKDFQLINLLYENTFDQERVMEIILLRYSKFGSYLIAELLSAVFIIVLFVVKPFIKKEKHEN